MTAVTHHTLMINEKTISFYQKDDTFNYSVFDHKMKKNEGSGPLDWGPSPHTTEEKITHILECIPIFDGDTVSFTTYGVLMDACDSAHRRIKLVVCEKGELIWRIFEGSTKSLCVSLDDAAVKATENCSRKSSALLKMLKSQNLAKKISILKNFRLKCWQANNSLDIYRWKVTSVAKAQGLKGQKVSPEWDVFSPFKSFFRNFLKAMDKRDPLDIWKNLSQFSFTLEPRAKKSRIDPRVRISPYYSTVALVANRGPCGNHAEILIEAIENGNYVMKKIHFVGPDGIKTKATSEKLRYTQRTRLWKRSSEKIEYRFRLNKSLKNTPIKFNQLGIHSILTACCRAHNCTTWAVEQLKKMDIDLGKSPGSFILTKAKDYTSKEKKFRDLNNSCSKPRLL